VPLFDGPRHSARIGVELVPSALAESQQGLSKLGWCSHPGERLSRFHSQYFLAAIFPLAREVVVPLVLRHVVIGRERSNRLVASGCG
jgi:hypothetical protein